MPRPRKPASPFRYFNPSPEVIRHVVMMNVRFPLSLRNVENLLFERGIDICHETVRLWWNRFGPLFAADIRRQRVSRMKVFRHWRWHLDEMYVKLNGEMVALFDLAIDSKLLGCDLVKLRIGDLVSGGSFRDRATVVQQKMGRPVQFEIMSEARKCLEAWLRRRGGTIADFVFPSRIDYLGQLSTRQYARLVDEWVSTVGLDKREYATHSMRRTKASMIYRATGNLRAVQILLGHSNIENAVTYLGVDVDDALTLSERTEI